MCVCVCVCVCLCGGARVSVCVCVWIERIEKEEYNHFLKDGFIYDQGGGNLYWMKKYFQKNWLFRMIEKMF